MRFVSSHDGQLQYLGQGESPKRGGGVFSTGLEAIDRLVPGGLARGAIHEVLVPPGQTMAMSFALVLARSAAGGSASGEACGQGGGEALGGCHAMVWCDPDQRLYPPAIAAAGVPLDRFYLIRPGNEPQLVWALAECLRCKGIGAVVGPVGRLSMIEARRLQLAAEQGGGVGLLLRSIGKVSAHYAAATRWLVEPAGGQRTVQRWKVQLIHGQGGRVNQAVLLEVCRETHTVRAARTLADRPVAAPAPSIRIAG